MENIFSSKSGLPTASIREKQIHSAYDPQKEADRFIDNTLAPGNTGTVLLLGAGLGYLYNSIKKRNPFSKVLDIRFSTYLWEQNKHTDRSWHPEAKMSVYEFIKRNLEEPDLKGLTILEWPASAEIYPRLSKEIHQYIREIIGTLNGNILTTGHFGRRWLKNVFSNYLHIDNQIKHVNIEGPVCIIAAGPSIEGDLKWLSSFKENINIIALPSSLPALIDADVKPDMVITTDPGHYAFYHIAHLRHWGPIPVAMPLTAARGVWHTASPVYYFNQGTEVEKLFSDSSQVIPSNGTVAGSALEFVLSKNTGPIIFMGLDLCSHDIKSHIRPETFELFRQRNMSRLSPSYSAAFHRMMETTYAGRPENVRKSKPLDTYAAWFRRVSGRTDQALFRYNPSAVKIAGFQSIDKNELRALMQKSSILIADIISDSRFSARADKIITTISFVKDLLLKSSRNKVLHPLISELFYYHDTPGYLAYREALTAEKEELSLSIYKTLKRGLEGFLSDINQKLNLEGLSR
jgi:hypothetical protein